MSLTVNSPQEIRSFSRHVNGIWEHSYLSNGYIEPDLSFVEREYQAYAKTTVPFEREYILAATRPFGPNGSKRRGRNATLRPDHDQIKFQVMSYFVAKKFRDHPELAARLLGTGQALLVEGNDWHDNIWGDCHCGNADGKHTECESKGLNWLGLVLMTVREELRLCQQK